ncbi:hypothetical protein HBI56_016280 [Parastagonospora nodorum]|uniref:Uncharacterized protein n=1 Tax=Phaeosphaeria nodorum (strain SN15 / ATCC MYA-4574 / FGSC 10173) TaxID=321614 RepID=A0A7U2F0Z3_PHANO|nr:hypothetical protein HBH56_083710 [Parastagonospora nodorum]QRC96759.1 hypothetical protein JI435_434090 [Parastagonospora nodorum SN15]KAH3929785.1 hypothetical protein HBH54_118110 [Parastagonospora nodorum]KAH3955457.1 hypothetical protein HBH53_006440 [Parastagonospora nodorum]KAH3976718.1 hypothetical protein HBH51_075060 [Parastagonospora nodorum]
MTVLLVLCCCHICHMHPSHSFRLQASSYEETKQLSWGIVDLLSHAYLRASRHKAENAMAAQLSLVEPPFCRKNYQLYTYHALACTISLTHSSSGTPSISSQTFVGCGPGNLANAKVVGRLISGFGNICNASRGQHTCSLIINIKAHDL